MWESLLPYPVLCLLLLFSYLQVTSSLSLNSASQSRKLCSSEESFALLNFKNSISINSSASSHCDYYAVSYPRTASWKQGSDCCSWDGVTCDTFIGHVTSLDLSSSWLLGTLEVNSSLFLLHHLRNLNLAFNNFQGYLGNVIKFWSVHINFGQEPQSLWTCLWLLLVLCLHHNYLQGEFPNEIFHLPFLQQLTLSKSIDLTGNLPMSNWSGPFRLFNLSSTTLTVLYLRQNNFLGQFPDVFGNLCKLKYLDLSQNNFRGQLPIQGPIPNSIFELVNLTFLDLSSNNLSGVLNIDMFSKLKNLKFVYLSNNSLSLQSPGSHSNVNFTLPKLEYFECSSCDLTEFPNFLRASENLKFLDLSNNSIPGRLGESELWHNMFYLDLSNNLLTSFEQISSMFLEHLDLDSNLLQVSLVPLPPTTRFISVANNKLTGEIPSSFCSFYAIGYIDLSNNSFSGMIPQCLASYGELFWLNLRMNNFYGSIPQTFSMCQRLMSLKFNGNQLEGPLLQSLAIVACKYYAGNNRIEDSFPHWLATLPDLQILILRSNRFHGPIDDSKTRLPFPKLQILDISHNLFTGNLPTTYFENFKAMIQGGELWTIVGDISLSLKFLIEVESLDLSLNKLDGKIPLQITSLTFLSVLNLLYNQLMGLIPRGNQFNTF
ncbi:hypothetical protein ACOSQ2_030565 [Xanthoceras sorbifolium]